MPKQTPNFRLGYYSVGERTNAQTESRRWNTIDSQLKGLYDMLGNGVLEGWSLSAVSTANTVSVSSGKGVISFISATSDAASTISGLVSGTTNYIFAQVNAQSYWTRKAIFSASVSSVPISTQIKLGSVTLNKSGIATAIDNSIRTNVGFTAAVQTLIRDHRHIGGTENPDHVNLATDVTGVIGQDNLPDLDASVVITGKFNPARIPLINHDTGLTEQGTLTHPQLDSFVQSLMHESRKLMGETALTNFLQLVLALKHQWPEVDEYLVNQIAFIPGISPDSMIDTVNTTATVDTRTSLLGGTHTISGTAAPAREIFTKTWDSQAEFEDAELASVSAYGGAISLSPSVITATIEDFESVSDWSTEIIDLSSSTGTFTEDFLLSVEGLASGKLDLNVDVSSNMSFVMSKSFASQDWGDYNRIVFYLNTSDVEHGDLYFFFEDEVAGAQGSFTIVLQEGEPTINRDSLGIGWREFSVDISGMSRSAVTKVGYYTSTNTGWNPSKPFSINVDNMYLSTGNLFSLYGTATFTFESTISQNFWKVRWDSSDPSGTVLKVRTRLADSVAEFSTGVGPAWSSYFTVSGTSINNPSGSLRKCAQIEVYMAPSPTATETPTLDRLYLDSYVSSVEEVFNYDSQDDWEAGTTVNMDTSTVPGEMSIQGTADVNNIFYGVDGGAIQADGALSSLFTMAGTALPKSTPQLLSGASASFGQLSGVCRGEGSTVWLADTENDRVVNINKDGSLVMGLYGSFLSEPIDPYGLEEKGPGSNKAEASTQGTDDDGEESISYPVALQSIYNPRTRQLSVVFDSTVETVHDEGTTFDPSKLMIKAGAHRVFFNSDAVFNLWGIDGDKYDDWVGADNDYISQFSFASHILQTTLSQADAASLNSIIDMAMPSLTVSSPIEQQMIYSSSVTVSFVVSNFTLGGSTSQKVRYRTDGGVYQYSTLTSVSLTGLSSGSHTLEATLLDDQGNPLNNSEASLTLSFVIQSSTYTLPHISISSPVQSQTLSTSPVEIAFSVINHPVTPTGSHIRYSIDSAVELEHRSLDPISISTLTQGAHTIVLALVDEFGTEVSSPYSSASISIFYGANSLANLNLSIEADAILASGRDEGTGVKHSSIQVSVADIVFENIYSPVDVAFVSGQMSSVNQTGQATVLIGKLRSPSTTLTLGTPPVSGSASADDDTTIFGDDFMDGHSVTEYLATTGSLIFSNNAAKFADSKEDSLVFLGSVERGSSGEILIADSVRKRAIITSTDLTTQTTNVIWEYSSDRNVLDFHMVNQDEINISIDSSIASPEKLTIQKNQNTVWTNNSATAVTIYSGSTTAVKFAEDPDLTLYGDDFYSSQLQPGESYSFTFRNIGEYPWFAYPSFVSGEITVSSARVSDRDKYLILENDTSTFMFGSRLIRVDSWGNIDWTFGEGYLANPKDARPMLGGSVIIST